MFALYCVLVLCLCRVCGVFAFVIGCVCGMFVCVEWLCVSCLWRDCVLSLCCDRVVGVVCVLWSCPCCARVVVLVVLVLCLRCV